MSQPSSAPSSDQDSQSKSPSRPVRQDNPILRYMYLLIALGALAYAGLGFVSLSEATRNERWPTVKGQVVSNEILEFERTKSDGTPIKTYQASVGYRYEIDGTFYLGTKLSLHPAERILKGVAETELEPYQLGNKVDVYYDPKNPDRAVLRSSDTVGAFQAISAGLCIGLVCLVLFFIGQRKKQASQD